MVTPRVAGLARAARGFGTRLAGALAPARLGLAVGPATVRAVVLSQGAIRWAGEASYAAPQDLAEVIARLAGESGIPVRRARVVLERPLLQCRTIRPAPPLRAPAAARYVRLEAARLFRDPDDALVLDGGAVVITRRERALWAVATSGPLVQAIVSGCGQAGLALEALGAAAEVLPATVARGPESGPLLVFPNGTTREALDIGTGGVWRSRLLRGTDGAAAPRWVAPLATLGPAAGAYAAAYGAAVRAPRWLLLPEESQIARRRAARRRLLVACGVALALWLAAGGVSVARVVFLHREAADALTRLRPALDSALALRRDLDVGAGTLATLARARAERSETLRMLAAVTAGLPDSVVLVAYRVDRDGTLHVAGYAPSAAGAVAALAHVAGMTDVHAEAPASRETLSGVGERERFSLRAEGARR